MSDSENIVLTVAHLRALLRRPISFHRVFAQVGGGAAEGLFLSQLFYWTEVMHEKADSEGRVFDGWIYKTIAEWESETALGRWEQETVRRNLRAAELVYEEKKGLPSRLFFRLNVEKLLAAVVECGKTAPKKGGKPHPRMRKNHIQGSGDSTSLSAETQQTRMAETGTLGSGKAPNLSAGKRQPFIGTETTSEITQTLQQPDDVGSSHFVPDERPELIRPTSEEHARWVALLVAERLPRATAEKLAGPHVPRVLEWYHDQDMGKIHSPVGLLRRALEDPDTYIPEAVPARQPVLKIVPSADEIKAMEEWKEKVVQGVLVMLGAGAADAQAQAVREKREGDMWDFLQDRYNYEWGLVQRKVPFPAKNA